MEKDQLEIEHLRKELLIRLERETAYVLAGEEKFKKELTGNDQMIRLIGEYLKENGSQWESWLDSKSENRFRK